MATSDELRQQRARIVESMREIVDRAEAENRDLDGQERESYDKGERDYTELSARISRQEEMEKRALATADTAPAYGAPDVTGDRAGRAPAYRDSDLPEDAPNRAGRMAFLDVIRHGMGEVAPEVRALVENTAGQILVPEELEADLIRSIPTLTVMRDLVTVRPTSRDRVRRRSIDEVSVGWGKLETDEQTLTDSMPSTPTEEYTYVEDLFGLAKIGADELDDSDVDLEAFVRDSFSRALGEAEDTAFTTGTGHSAHKPVGWAQDIYNSSTNAGGIHVVAGASTDYVQSGDANWALIDDLQKLIYAVPAQARRNGSFVMASATELFISTRRNSNGDRLWQPATQAGRPNTFLGYAIHNQEDVPAIAANKVIAGFGDWKLGYRILDRRGMTIQRLVELYAEDDMIGFKVKRRVGGDVRIADALRLLQTKAS